MNEKVTKLQEMLQNDEAFAKQVFEAESTESVQSLLSSKGLDFSIEELDALKELVEKLSASDADELGEDALEQVAGGLVGKILAGLGITAVVGIAGFIGGYKKGYEHGYDNGSTDGLFSRW